MDGTFTLVLVPLLGSRSFFKSSVIAPGPQDIQLIEKVDLFAEPDFHSFFIDHHDGARKEANDSVDAVAKKNDS